VWTKVDETPVYWVEWDGMWCELMVCEWMFCTTCDSFMLALHVQSASDVHGLKLASSCGCDPGIKFWQVLARRVRDACKHECRVTPLLMVEHEHHQRENNGQYAVRIKNGRAGECD
jgi:hypothetical protein